MAMITVLPFKSSKAPGPASANDIVLYSLFQVNHILALPSVLIVAKPGTLMADIPASFDLT